MNELNEKEYEWLRTEMRRCITVNEGILAKNDPNDEELEDAWGIKTGIEYVFWLMDVGIYQPGTQGRSPGPLYNVVDSGQGQSEVKELRGLLQAVLDNADEADLDNEVYLDIEIINRIKEMIGNRTEEE